MQASIALLISLIVTVSLLLVATMWNHEYGAKAGALLLAVLLVGACTGAFAEGQLLRSGSNYCKHADEIIVSQLLRDALDERGKAHVGTNPICCSAC